jgi:NAD(P)-dependent dehydrogenase (short-subunit alcohol dehydrogenase family)
MSAPVREMNGKVCMVTGASGGMGRCIAAALAESGATVVVVCRTPQRATELCNRLKVQTGQHGIVGMAAELGRLSEVRTLAHSFRREFDRLDLLVNNAGAHFRQRQLSADGIELHLAVNYLAPLLLTLELEPVLARAAPSRVVNVVSDSMSDTRLVKLGRPRPVALELDDLQAERRYHPMRTYARSKLALLMCGYHLAREWAGRGIAIQALHPGLIATDIVKDVAPAAVGPLLGLIKLLLRTPEEGAAATLAVALQEAPIPATGGYFVAGLPRRSPPESYDIAKQGALFAASLALLDEQAAS